MGCRTVVVEVTVVTEWFGTGWWLQVSLAGICIVGCCTVWQKGTREMGG